MAKQNEIQYWITKWSKTFRGGATDPVMERQRAFILEALQSVRSEAIREFAEKVEERVLFVIRLIEDEKLEKSSSQDICQAFKNIGEKQREILQQLVDKETKV